MGHPLDSLKVHLQTGRTGATPSFRKLYSGIVPPLTTVGAFNALNFMVYDNTRRLLFQRDMREGNVMPPERRTGGRELLSNYITDDSMVNIALSGGQ